MKKQTSATGTSDKKPSSSATSPQDGIALLRLPQPQIPLQLALNQFALPALGALPSAAGSPASSSTAAASGLPGKASTAETDAIGTISAGTMQKLELPALPGAVPAPVPSDPKADGKSDPKSDVKSSAGELFGGHVVPTAKELTKPLNLPIAEGSHVQGTVPVQTKSVASDLIPANDLMAKVSTPEVQPLAGQPVSAAVPAVMPQNVEVALPAVTPTGTASTTMKGAGSDKSSAGSKAPSRSNVVNSSGTLDKTIAGQPAKTDLKSGTGSSGQQPGTGAKDAADAFASKLHGMTEAGQVTKTEVQATGDVAPAAGLVSAGVQNTDATQQAPGVRPSVEQNAAAAALPSSHVPDVQAAPGVNSAQLVQSIHQSEMKLGMQSVEFGNISINTSISHQVLSAQISTEHAALSQALAVHLPAIEEKLGTAYGVQARVELRDATSSSQSGAQHQTSQDQSSPARFGGRSSIGSESTSAIAGSHVQHAHESSRLDIRI